MGSALVIVCGHPCSGKSRAAAQLVDLIRQQGQDAVVVDEDSLHLERSQSYKDVPSEKNTRGLLRSTADRSLTQRRVVVLDSLNNIKGFRYELWCVARTAGARYCMLHVDAPPETCREWNRGRPPGGAYPDEIFEDLVGRFERPDGRNRWDSPLFTLRPLLGDAHVAEVLAAVAKVVAHEPAQPSHAASEAAAAQGPGFSGAASRDLAPTVATTSPALSATNLLHEVDQATQDILSRVSEAQATAGSGAAGRVDCGEGGLALDLQRAVTLPELRRHKRAFLKLVTNQTFGRCPDARAVRRLFVDYLRGQLVPQ